MDAYSWPVGIKYEPYLQGSYGNDTNIYGNSDVDLVVQLNSTFYYDLDMLTPQEQQAFERDLHKASYGWQSFRDDVMKALNQYLRGASITQRPKCIKVETTNFKTDVVVCAQHKRYYRYTSPYDYDAAEGMQFYVPDDRWVVNFPKAHLDNGIAKNSGSQTGGNFKPSVRMLKNARSHLVSKGIVSKDTAPSYFVECMLYNVPSELFSANRHDAFYSILKWLCDNRPKTDNTADFVCQNELIYLFGGILEQWNTQDANTLINAWVQLWNDWE